jgi:hypothetical protein
VAAKKVQYGPALVRSLEHSLRTAFNQPNIGLTKKPNMAGPFYVLLEYGDRVATTNDGTPQDVIEILIRDSQRALRRTGFYVGFVGRFNHAGGREYRLDHASLSVFYSVVGDLLPLFRAEWDELAAQGQSRDAQPHWHFVQSPKRIEGIVRTLAGAQGEPGEFNPTGCFPDLADCGKLHFAMASLSDDNFRYLFDSGEFQQWFRGLTQYIGSQVGYLVETMPASDTEGIMEFEPSGTWEGG